MKKFFAAAMLIMGSMSGMNAGGYVGTGYGSAYASTPSLRSITENNSDAENTSSDLNAVVDSSHQK